VALWRAAQLPLQPFRLAHNLPGAAFLCIQKYVLKILWDEPKRLTNLKRHRMDLADLEYAFSFFAEARIVSAKRGRLMAIGEFEGMAISVVFRQLGTEAISLISMRRASRKERRL
jgi:uncharacterized DUF497 family protein